MNIKDKVVFVTGGASGIGLATAQKLRQEDARVVIFSCNVEKVRNMDDGVLVIEGDVRNRNQVKTAMEHAVEKFGDLDILINNAGVARREKFLETDVKDWDFVIDVNFKGIMICIQEFIRTLARNHTEQTRNNTERSPRISAYNQRNSARNIDKLIINIASGAGIYGVDEIAVYSATKAAVINLSQSLNEELKNTGIKFITIAPGATDTKMFASLFPEEQPYHTPDQVADVIYKSIIGEIKPDNRLIVDVFRHAR